MDAFGISASWTGYVLGEPSLSTRCRPIVFGSSSPDTFHADFSMPPAFLARALMSTVDISGNASDEMGRPLPSGFVVTIATDDDEDELSIATGLIDSAGHFDMRIPAGNYRMVAYAPGYYPTFTGGSRTWELADSIIVPPAGLATYLWSWIP
jgi:hypothetical protein